MSGKKYKKFLERLKYQSPPTYRCMIYEYYGDIDSEFILAKYSDKCFQVLHNICGGSVREHYCDSDIERYLDLDEANTKMLMLRTGTHDGEGLIDAIRKRFSPFDMNAKAEIEKFCQQKEIEYKTFTY